MLEAELQSRDAILAMQTNEIIPLGAAPNLQMLLLPLSAKIGEVRYPSVDANQTQQNGKVCVGRAIVRLVEGHSTRLAMKLRLKLRQTAQLLEKWAGVERKDRQVHPTVTL